MSTNVLLFIQVRSRVKSLDSSLLLCRHKSSAGLRPTLRFRKPRGKASDSTSSFAGRRTMTVAGASNPNTPGPVNFPPSKAVGVNGLNEQLTASFAEWSSLIYNSTLCTHCSRGYIFH
ncbi:hypothetical protein BDW22DRAFT_1360535 [Trametopsis cervina]|nr:hypothetical protein BDW22DRAFT_1360535 [Trametopsis cervina]